MKLEENQMKIEPSKNLNKEAIREIPMSHASIQATSLFIPIFLGSAKFFFVPQIFI